jgi:hypothetical protein
MSSINTIKLSKNSIKEVNHAVLGAILGILMDALLDANLRSSALIVVLNTAFPTIDAYVIDFYDEISCVYEMRLLKAGK